MKCLFLLLDMPSKESQGGMYVDLAKMFFISKHDVTIMAPDMVHAKTFCGSERGMRVVRVASKETQGVSNMYQKGIALVSILYSGA